MACLWFSYRYELCSRRATLSRQFRPFFGTNWRALTWTWADLQATLPTAGARGELCGLCVGYHDYECCPRRPFQRGLLLYRVLRRNQSTRSVVFLLRLKRGVTHCFVTRREAEAAIASHPASTQSIRDRPLAAGGQSRAGSDAAELRQEHHDLHDMGTFDDAITTTRRHSRLPHLGLLRPRVLARPRVGQGSHAELRFGRNGRTGLATIKQRSSRMEDTSTLDLNLPLVELMAMVGTAVHANLRVFALAFCDLLFRILVTQRMAHYAGNRSCTTSNKRGCPAPTPGSSLESDRARCFQQNLGQTQ